MFQFYEMNSENFIGFIYELLWIMVELPWIIMSYYELLLNQKIVSNLVGKEYS